MRQLFTATALLASALAAQAAEPVGTLDQVQGAVTIGGSGLVMAARQGAVLKAGDTITVSSTGKATVVLKDGCVVPLRPSQYLRLNGKLTCSQLFASVVQLNSPYRQAFDPGYFSYGGTMGAGSGSSMVAAIAAGVVAVVPVTLSAIDKGIDASGN